MRNKKMPETFITNYLDIWTGAVTRKPNGRGRQPANGQAGGSYELTGIQKLRELILELAVQGKLVPQEPEDEPASELLKRIEEEKQRLADEGKIKKPKKLPEVTEEEKRFELPEGWVWSRLGTTFNDMISGGTPSKNNPKFWGGSIPWASVKDLGHKKHVDRTQDFITEEGLKAGSKLADSGDILICTRMGLGKVAICDCPIAINQDLKAIKLSSNVSVEYFLLAYSTLDISGTGTTVAGITQEMLLNYVIALPPLEEQHRIAQKVDELMALCDRLEQQTADQLAAHETLVDTLLDTLTRSADAAELAENWSRLETHFDTLFTTEHSIDRLKETILQLAVMGKLVPQDPKEEPASELLKRIEEEKQRLVDEGKIKKPKKLAEVTEEEKPFEVPEGWELITLSHLGSFSGGKTPSKNKPIYWDGDIPWVTPKDMKNAKIHQSEDHVTKIAVDEGLELFPERTIFFVVRSGILRRMFPVAINSMPCTINQDLKGLKLFDDSIAEYIQLMMLGFESYILENLTKTGTTVESLKFDEFTKQPFPIPPLEEQHRIVRKVDELMALCDRLKARLAEVGELRVQLAEVVVEETERK